MFILNAVVVTASATLGLSDDFATELAKGEQMLRTVAATAELGETTTLYEHVVQAYGVGVATTSVEVKEDGVQYTHDSVLHLPSGAKIRGRIEAVLSPLWEPREINVLRKQYQPDGSEQERRIQMRVDDAEITIERIEGGDRSKETVQRPEGMPLVMFEELFSRLPLDPKESFAFTELDPTSGNTNPIVFKVGDSTDEGTRVDIDQHTARGELLKGYFIQEAPGSLLEYSEPGLPVVLRKCTEERHKEVIRVLGLEEILSESVGNVGEDGDQ